MDGRTIALGPDQNSFAAIYHGPAGDEEFIPEGPTTWLCWGLCALPGKYIATILPGLDGQLAVICGSEQQGRKPRVICHRSMPLTGARGRVELLGSDRSGNVVVYADELEAGKPRHVLIRQPLVGRPDTVTRLECLLPADASFVEAALSPSGDKIAWLLKKSQHGTDTWFVYLTGEAGRDFRIVTPLEGSPANHNLFSNLQWLPDSSAVSVIGWTDLYVIPVR